MPGFHSFEVGFGLEKSNAEAAEKIGFHSFEVGFGPVSINLGTQKETRFHSFEVGFGRSGKDGSARVSVSFSFLRGRLRTKRVIFLSPPPIQFSFLRGRLRTRKVGK